VTAIRIEDLPGGSREAVDEKKLTLAFKAGDQSAYRFIYTRFESRVHHLCRRMLSDHGDAAEATQETFLRVYLNLGQFNGQYQLGAWIARIATNVCLDQIRHRQRRPIDATPLEVVELDPPVDAIEDGPEETVMRLSETRRVRRVLGQLPPLHRAAIVLRDFEGLRYSEIADILEITDGQVKALIHRARQNFKRSWTASIASLFMSTRLARIRKLDTPVGDHATSAAATQATEVATSAATMVGHCGAAAQTCGQFMSDKAAAIVTAALVGAAAAGGGIIAGAHESKPVQRPPARFQASGQSPTQNHAGARGSDTPFVSMVMEAPANSASPSRGNAEPVAEPNPVAPPPAERTAVEAESTDTDSTEEDSTDTDSTEEDSTESEEADPGAVADSNNESKPPPAEPPPPAPAPADEDSGDVDSIETGSDTVAESPNEFPPSPTESLPPLPGDTDSGDVDLPTAGD
jgi:RNA polymerase sigma-70 factor (ECF subfamily)